MTVGRDLNIAGFDIAVNDRRLACVQIFQRVTDRRANYYGVILVDRPQALHALAQVLAIDKIHDKILPLITHYKMIRNTRQVGMPQICKDHCLQPKLAGIFICGKKIFLEGYIHPEIFIHGAIYRSHPALAQNFNHAIAFMQESAAFEGHPDSITKVLSKAW